MTELSVITIYIGGLMSGLLAYDMIVRYRRKPLQSKPADEQPQEIIVQRTRPSFRNPGRPISKSYESFKTKNGLYGAVKPGRSGGEEVEKN